MKTFSAYIAESEAINEGRLERLDKLMDEDEDYMGGLATNYISKRSCTREEYAEAGKQWAQDELDNENITQEEYEDAIEHYNNF